MHTLREELLQEGCAEGELAPKMFSTNEFILVQFELTHFFLQRHILVKGCGKDTSTDGGNTNTTSSVTSASTGAKDDDSTVRSTTKSDSHSEKGSPVVNGH